MSEPATDSGFREGVFRSQDDLELYWRDYGDPASPRMPVLCLSGLTRNSKDFHLLARRSCRERRVLATDYRGRGRSARDPDWRQLPAGNLSRRYPRSVDGGGRSPRSW